LVSALIDAGIQSARESRLAELLAAQKFAADKTFNNGLIEAIKARGYEVKTISVTRSASNEFLNPRRRRSSR